MGRFTKEDLKIRRMTPKDIQLELDRFESLYKMSSAEFYLRYNKGDLPGEGRDYVRWAAYYDMAARAGMVNGRARSEPQA